MPDWNAVHSVDATLAARLVHAQFPELAGEAPVRVGHGWDNDVWRFGAFAFRFPRRPEAVGLIAAETAVLPALRVPLSIPVPTHLGAPTEAFPHPFVGVPFLEGETADRVDPGVLPALAAPLGAFLGALHRSPPPTGLPECTTKSDRAWRLRKTHARLPLLARTRWADRIAEIAARLEAPLPDDPRRAVCHGDLYLRHVLVRDGAAAGVIDWGDVRWGRPAMDLNVAYAVFEGPARAAFWDAYGPADAAIHAWARFYALHYGVLLTAYGAEARDAVIGRVGERALGNVLDPG
jgi:aminoglycoside phosphotransferase (APT) family kinase protein